MRILLIDDDEDDQALFCEAVKLIAPGIQCDVASNGKDGLTLLETTSSLQGVVFLDINMPVLDGHETLKGIRTTPRLSALPVIIYSTSNNLTDINSFMALGAGYIIKPNSFEELVAKLSPPILNLVQTRQSTYAQTSL